MSETTPPAAPTSEQVRRAAEALKAAIDRHLLAVESRADELDPAVLDAFNALAAAAEEYDELLYAVHDEVTPFEVPTEPPTEYAGPDEVEAFSVFIRRDYLIADPEALAAAVRAAAEGSEGDGAGTAVVDSRAAVAELFDAYDADEIAYRAEEVGLESGESTLWVVAGDPDALGGWHDDPFADADAERLLYRVDVVDEDEDDEDEEIEDLEDDEFDEDEDDEEEEAEDEDELDGEPSATV
ncbi:MAG TPA: hypothetical protein VGM10_03305 [Actinocrinis sp.]|jgi:hypothetical protein